MFTFLLWSTGKPYDNSVIHCSENIDVFNVANYDNSVIHCSENIVSISPP